MSDEPDAQLAARIADILGWMPRSWRRAHGGYTPTARYAVADDRQSAFVKVATTTVTVDMLHRENAV